MNLHKKINLQEMNAAIDPIAHATGAVFWLRSLDYQQQLYVSPNYETLWHRSPAELYQNPASWINTLVAEDRDALALSFHQRKHYCNNRENSFDLAKEALLFRVAKPNGELTYIRDRAFLLADNQGRPYAIAGIGQPLDSEAWSQEKQATTSLVNQYTIELENTLFILLNQILQLKPTSKASPQTTATAPTAYSIAYKNGHLKLSFREAQCLYYSMQGYSAKQIAYELNLSMRTVETYLNHLKEKANCRTKYHLLSHLDAGLIHSWAESIVKQRVSGSIETMHY